MPRLPRLLLAPALLGAFLLPLGLGAALSACDTAGCEGGALLTEDLVVGDGEEATASSTVTVAYTGRLEDGTLFDDATVEDPATFDLDGTIQGFRNGIAGMRVGGQRRITIPPEMAYGEEGNGPVPACATIVFEVTLLDVQ
jgi:peptidylprolyl isomerase